MLFRLYLMHKRSLKTPKSQASERNPAAVVAFSVPEDALKTGQAREGSILHYPLAPPAYNTEKLKGEET